MSSELSATRNDIFNGHDLFVCEVIFSAMAQCLTLLFRLVKMLVMFLTYTLDYEKGNPTEIVKSPLI